ncbi:MAG: hypothetical protein NVSMB10_11140 [Steroidobacteraceae bacterium]
MNDSSDDGDASPDRDDRVADFLERHGGAGVAGRRHESADVWGWSEVYAADGYTLRCDWTKIGSQEEMRFSEIPPEVKGAH